MCISFRAHKPVAKVTRLPRLTGKGYHRIDMLPSEIDRVLDSMDRARVLETEVEELRAFVRWRSWRVNHGLAWKPCDTGAALDAANTHADC